MEGFTIIESENRAPTFVGKVTKGSSGTVARKKLADISNLQQQPRNSTEDEKSRYSSNTTKEYIEHLQKENMALMKMLAERNKVIELSGNELQKLRVNLQKMQQQNLQLAQSNSLMLAELNSGKDRLKALEHELGCKNGLLKAMMSEEVGKLKLKACQKLANEVKSTRSDDPGESTMEGRDENEQNRTRRRPQSKSLGPSRQVEPKEKAGNKRSCLRRQSARFKSEELESSKGLVESDDVQLSFCPSTIDSIPGNGSTSMNGMVIDEDKDANATSCHEPQELRRLSFARPSCQAVGNAGPSHEPQEIRRSSFARPFRQAAKKVQSYKEMPVNLKMRRPE